MDADTFYGKAQEVSLAGGDVFVYPALGRALRVHSAAGADRKIKLPVVDSRSPRGARLLAIWNDNVTQQQVATFSGVNIKAIPANGYAVLSYFGAPNGWRVQVL